MSSDFGVIGNGEMLAKVRADGALTEAFYPSIGFFRHLVQSQFGIHFRETGECAWLAPPEFQVEQRYLEDTNVLQTSYLRPEVRARVVDFVHPDLPGAIRTLEVQNLSEEPITLDLFHTEASSVADHKGEFGYNVAYYNRLDNHVVRYRGHPWDKAIEAQVVWLISGCRSRTPTSAASPTRAKARRWTPSWTCATATSRRTGTLSGIPPALPAPSCGTAGWSRIRPVPSP
jgi:hypothetical protein